MTTTDPKIAEAAEVLRQAVADMAPVVPQMSGVANILAAEADITVGTARKRLRQAIEQSGGTLHELRLTLSSYRTWQVVLPGAPAGVGCTWLGQTRRLLDGSSGEIITFDKDKGHHPYGAGKTSWLITSNRIQELCAERLAALAAQDAKRKSDSQDRLEADREELQRRDPELLEVLNQMDDLLMNTPDVGGEADYRFRIPRESEEDMPLKDRQLVVSLDARTPAAVAVLKKVLIAGLAATFACDLPACGEPAAPYSYTDGQNHRLALSSATDAVGTRYVQVEAENMAIGGASVRVWLTADQTQALDRSLADRINYEATDHTGDTLTVTMSHPYALFEVTRVPVDSLDGDPATVPVVVLTGYIPEVRRALTAAMGTPDDAAIVEAAREVGLVEPEKAPAFVKAYRAHVEQQVKEPDVGTPVPVDDEIAACGASLFTDGLLDGATAIQNQPQTDNRSDLDRRYPEHAKLTKIKSQSNIVYDFLLWAAGKGFQFGQNLPERTTAFEGADVPMEFQEASGRALTELLAERFGIDLKVLDAEKDQMVEDLRAATTPEES